jgi:hypothetical protein
MQRTLRLSAAPQEVLLIAALAATLIPTMYGTHPGEGLRHWLAAVIAAAAGISLVAVAVRDVAGVDLVRVIVALASAGAATVHFAVISEHVDQWWLFGVFFAGSGLTQALFAVLVLLLTSPMIYAAGALGNAGIVVLWIVTRTVGLPFGPNSGEAELVGTADVIATVLEAIIVFGCVVLLMRPLRLGIRRPLLAGLLVTAAVVTTIALVSVTGTHADHQHPAGHVDHHD